MGESDSDIGKPYAESGYDLYDKEKEIEKSRECDLWPAFSGCDWSMLPDEQLVGCMAAVPG